MDLLARQKYFILAIGILVLLNLVSIFFLWNGRPEKLPPPDGNEKMGGFLTHELKLDQTQLEKFDEYRKEHFETTSSISHQINEKKKEIMEEVFSDNPDTEKVNKLAGEIGKLNTQFEKFLFHHFMKLKSVLNPDQDKRFENLVNESMKPRPAQRPVHPPDAPGPDKMPPPPK